MRKSLEGLQSLIRDRTYPNLPEELQPFYVYLSDCGHSLMGIAKTLLDSTEFGADELWELEAAIPVKYVLSHPYQLYHGHLVVDVPYSTYGIEVDEEYEEF